MTILIKGMDMPKDERIIVAYPDGRTKLYKRSDMVKVPTPHGRLIDADELLEIGNKTGLWCNDRWHIKASAIHDAPTVIEAEGE